MKKNINKDIFPDLKKKQKTFYLKKYKYKK